MRHAILKEARADLLGEVGFLLQPRGRVCLLKDNIFAHNPIVREPDCSPVVRITSVVYSPEHEKVMVYYDDLFYRGITELLGEKPDAGSNAFLDTFSTDEISEILVALENKPK